MLTLYPLAFISAVICLSLWFATAKRGNGAPFMLLFYVSLSAWAFSLFSAYLPTEDKVPILLRDLLMMAGVPLLMRAFAESKVLFLGMLMLIAALYYSFGWRIWSESLQNSHLENPTGESIPELLAEITNGKQISDLQEIADRYDLLLFPAFTLRDGETTDLDDYITVNIPDEKMGQKAEITAALQKSGLTDWTEDNEVFSLDEPPVITRKLPQVNIKFGVNDPDLEKQWAMQALAADKLYNFLRQTDQKPQRKARIFILDTGVDARHEDLAARYRSHAAKYDKDPKGHGTHCAGIAAAVTNNSKGVASLAPTDDYVEITSIRVLNSFGFGTQTTIINGMLEAADNGADVISMSLGSRSTDESQRAFRMAVEYANERGAIVIAAAGNDGSDAAAFAPASVPGVICVAAADNLLQRADFSNYVQNIPMAVSAPGTSIYSTFPGNKYVAQNGTSMAAPYVSGLTGLLKSFKPDLTTEEVFDILQESGIKTKSGAETGMFIQPERAVKKCLGL